MCTMPLDFVADVEVTPALLRELEGVADDPGHADAREDGLLDRHLVGEAAVQPAADLAVLTLDVLSYDDQVQLVAAAYRTVDAGEGLGRPHVGELAEGSPDRDQQSPQGHVVGDARPADRAEEDRVEVVEDADRVGGHHRAGLDVPLARPVEVLVFQ